MKTKYFTKCREFDGVPKVDDFKYVEKEIDEKLEDGEILTEALIVSVDPYIRLNEFQGPPGSPVGAFQVASVLKSNVEEYPKGSVVMYHGGWITINKVKKDEIWYRVDQLLSKENYSQAVGVLGMTGLTAYVGFLDFCKPKKGDTVMVNASSGAVGLVVGQIAKIKGCRVIGCCGSDEKIEFCKSIGFDELFNYKKDNCLEAVKRMAPDGIDCYYDSVGGQMSSDVMSQMNQYGRICIIGFTAGYNKKETMRADNVQDYFVHKELEMWGFVIFNPIHKPRFQAALKDMSQWIKEGKLINRETITHGFENIPQAFVDQILGKTIGKAAVVL